MMTLPRPSINDQFAGRSKQRPTRSNLRRATHLLAVVMVLALLSACGPAADVIGDRKQPTPTPGPRTTATPGGKLSVWLVTPTGQITNPLTPTPGLIQGGNPVGPAATATAAQATIAAATATAGAPLAAPYYQPNECPAPGAPVPPVRPAAFDDYSVIIGQFLSGGGSSTVLEATLRNWGALTDRGGVVQADTDLTGDGVLEIIMTLYNPQTYTEEAQLNAGILLVYGCDGGGYRLLYRTDFNPTLSLPELLRVGDMNADVRGELVYMAQSCSGSSCISDAKILTWNSIVGSFEELNTGQVIAINGRISIADVDGDGVLEVTTQVNPSGSTSAGPSRAVVDTWDWNGTDYVLAQREQEEMRYRIHAVYEADDLLRDGQLRSAITAYANLRDNRSLQSWASADDTANLRAYAAYRIVIAFASLGSARADDWITLLNSEAPAGSAGGAFAQMGTAFMDNFRATGDARAACAAAVSAGASTNAISLLNSYGYNNRTYTLGDLCPF